LDEFCGILDAFETQTLGKLYVEMERFDDARQVLGELKANPWVSYWLAKADLGSGNPTEALSQIESALLLLGDKTKYRSSFLALRSDIRWALEARNHAIEDIREAVRECEGGKYRVELEERLRRLEASVSQL